MLFNAHHIHLDKDYAVQKEGYGGKRREGFDAQLNYGASERLVHGPLTALMLLEAVVYHRPESKLKEFKYLATDPLIVGPQHIIYGQYVTEKQLKLSCISGDGVRGMIAEVELE